MSDRNYFEVSKKYRELGRFAKELDSQLRAPFMTLISMGLLIIPEIKLSDKGVFDVSKFEFMDLFASPYVSFTSALPKSSSSRSISSSPK